MSRIKKYIIPSLIFLLAAGGLTFCMVKGYIRFPSLKGETSELASENESDYLMPIATKTVSGKDAYVTTEVIKGEFIQTTPLPSSEWKNYVRNVKLDYGYGQMILDEYCIQSYGYVNEGDVIAKVHIDVDELDLEEKELELKRLNQEYSKFQTDTQKNLDKSLENVEWIHKNRYDGEYQIAQAEYTRDLHNYEASCKNYEKRAADLQELIDKMKRAMAITEIVAPFSGYVQNGLPYQPGSIMLDNNTIVCLADLIYYIRTMDNTSNHLNYGRTAAFEDGSKAFYSDDGKPYMIFASIVTATPGSVSKQLSNGNTACIKVAFGPDEASAHEVPVEEMQQSMREINGLFHSYGLGDYLDVKGYPFPYSVQEDVLMVKVSAVTIEENQTYITLVNEDGTLTKQYFISGGSNGEYYWAMKGLEEGMLCLD